MEYADESTLDSYLNKHIVKLSLYDKYRLAIQLASAVLYMHECDIIHRNLNPKNILVHQKNIKVAGFGLAKKNSESTINIPQIFGVIPYIDPKFLSNHNYELDKKSDVYSIGVLMWQISSGRQPYSTTDIIDDTHLISSILG
ncbi:Gin4p [Rhizophagus irregularis DAOM 197198w]|uniref:Gin4p n=1 Tax=Rhizophagus irregularis (strain DAOM 197198w) TaxID=1432141 RepID=A0A015JDM4_RHIIW|nr:Gin4p [Rhizophagus irregularis DAOM 197198w]